MAPRTFGAVFAVARHPDGLVTGPRDPDEVHHPDRARRRTPRVADASYARTDDVGLVIAIARYHTDAFAEAYRRHAGAVFGLAQRLLWERTLAEEIVQEVFLRLWERPERFDQARGSLRSFLLMDTHARCVDRIRSDSRRREREERSARAELVADYDLDLEAHDLEIAEQVREALATLSDGERRAIELAYFGGHTYREVARILEQPEGTIKSRIRTGLTRLRAQLVDRGIDGSWIVN
jgi:RNA polymerase sigma-70 factor (ECF subfamily)